MPSWKYKVVLASFPFGEILVRKIRPALCISEPVGKYAEVLTVYITSKKIEEKVFSDLIVEDPVDLKQAGLKTASTIRLHRVFTIPKELIFRELGYIPKYLQSKIDIKITKILEIANSKKE